jgi:hypothetical protein
MTLCSPAGLLDAITAACPALTALMQPTQQQQQQQQQSWDPQGRISCAAMLVDGALHLWGRPSAIMEDANKRPPAASMLAVSSLIMAAVKVRPASSSSSVGCTSNAPQADTSSSNAQDAHAVYVRNRKALYSATDLPRSGGHALHVLATAFCWRNSEDDSLVDLLLNQPEAAANLGQVLYMYLAWVVQLQQQAQRGRTHAGSSSSSSRGAQQQQQQEQQSVRQAQVPPWHVQFLAAMGIPAWRADWRQLGAGAVLHQQALLTAVHRYSVYMQAVASGGVGSTDNSVRSAAAAQAGGSSVSSSSSSSSSSCVAELAGNGQQLESGQQAGMQAFQASLEKHLPARETLLLLLLLLEVLLLNQPDGENAIVTVLSMHCYLQIICLLDSMQPAQVRALAAAEAAADALLQPVLHLLGPALPQLTSTSNDSSSIADISSSSFRRQRDIEQLHGFYSKVVEMAAIGGEVELQADAVRCSGGAEDTCCCRNCTTLTRVSLRHCYCAAFCLLVRCRQCTYQA